MKTQKKIYAFISRDYDNYGLKVQSPIRYEVVGAFYYSISW